MELAGQSLPKVPTVPDQKIRELRCRLIMEEALEACEALGFYVFAHSPDPILKDEFSFASNDKPISLAEIGKELADLGVVGEDGTGLACGINMERVRDLVDENNLGKFGPGSYKNQHGKHCKPPDYPKPNIQKEIDWQINNPELNKIATNEVDEQTRKGIFHQSV